MNEFAKQMAGIAFTTIETEIKCSSEKTSKISQYGKNVFFSRGSTTMARYNEGILDMFFWESLNDHFWSKSAWPGKKWPGFPSIFARIKKEVFFFLMAQFSRHCLLVSTPQCLFINRSEISPNVT